MSYVILDVETTGHDEADVIQIAILNPFGKSFLSNVRPDKRIFPASTAIHGVTDEEAATYPEKSGVKAALREYVQKELPPGVVVIGHNIEFDADNLVRNFHLTPQKTLCTLRMARKLIKKDDIGGYRLDAVYYYLFRDKLKEMLAARNAHDAMRDCTMTHDIYKALVTIATANGEIPVGADMDTILAWAAQPMLVETWPFGKHKGLPLDHDWGYVSWYMNQKDPDPDIAYSINRLRASRPGARYSR